MNPFRRPPPRSVLFVCAIVAGAAALSACGKRDPRAARIAAGEVAINIGGDPRTLDPNLSTDTMSSQAIEPFVRGLTFVDAEGKPRPEIAERWETSEDGRIYDFHLRETKWTNGEPVTAADFAYAWLDRMLDPAFGAEYAYMLNYVEGAQRYFETREGRDEVAIEVVGPRHLRVRLVCAAPFFPQLVAHHSYYPVCASHVRANPDWALRAETYVGNGPFVMESYASGDRIVGRKNPDYWNAAEVAMNRIVLRFIEEESTARIAVSNGDLDATTAAPRTDIEAMRADGTLRIAPQLGTYYLNLNMKSPKFADPRVRRALNLAIDRAAIAEHVARAGEKPALGLVPPSLFGGEPIAYVKDAAFDEAKRLMAEAGYPDGKGFPRLNYIYNTLEVHRDVAQVVQEGWKNHLGVEMVPSNQEFKVLIEKRRAGDFDVARNGWIADFADPINFLEIFLSDSGNNDSHWADPEFDELLARARVEADPARRVELLKEAEAHLMEALPIVPIYSYSIPYQCVPELEGFELNPRDEFDAARLRWKK